MGVTMYGIFAQATKANFTEDAIGFIKVRASERPHVEIAPGVASVNADIHMEAYVRDEGEVFFLFSADVVSHSVNNIIDALMHSID